MIVPLGPEKRKGSVNQNLCLTSPKNRLEGGAKRSIMGNGADLRKKEKTEGQKPPPGQSVPCNRKRYLGKKNYRGVIGNEKGARRGKWTIFEDLGKTVYRVEGQRGTCYTEEQLRKDEGSWSHQL